MRSFLPTLAAGAAALAIALAPAAAATAASGARSAPHYTLRVTGNGTHATVGWVTMTVSKNGTPSNPRSGTSASAHEPWSKHVSAKADVVEVFAVQKHGTRLGCTIIGPSGKVLSRSTSYGKGAIVTCIVAKSDLFSGVKGL
jgi:hypothetical protein